MNFWIFILTILVLYCLYEVHEMKKDVGKKEDSSQTIDMVKVHYERLVSLYGKTCEIQFIKDYSYMYVLGASTLRVVVEEVDLEWVMLKIEKSKKKEKILMRIDTIKDIIEISS